MPVGIRGDREPGPVQTGRVILPGLTTLTYALPTLGEFDRRLRQATTQPQARVGVVGAAGQVLHAPSAGQFFQVMSNPQENTDHPALVHGACLLCRTGREYYMRRRQGDPLRAGSLRSALTAAPACLPSG